MLYSYSRLLPDLPPRWRREVRGREGGREEGEVGLQEQAASGADGGREVRPKRQAKGHASNTQARAIVRLPFTGLSTSALSVVRPMFRAIVLPRFGALPNVSNVYTRRQVRRGHVVA